MELKEPLFYNRPIPPDVFKVSVATVKPGHGNLAPPVLMGDDDETTRWLGDCCNGWVLLWPKNLLRLEAAGSTPTSTQLGMNINTSPPPLVAGDIAIDEDEDEDDDDTEQYVNTCAYLGFERHESVPELPPPESERIMDNLPVVKKSRKRPRKGKKLLL